MALALFETVDGKPVAVNPEYVACLHEVDGQTTKITTSETTEPVIVVGPFKSVFAKLNQKTIEPDTLPHNEPAKRMTPPQVAKLYNVSPDTVRRWIINGDLIAANLGTTKRPRYRITPDSLAEFDKRRRAHSMPKRARRFKREKLLVNEFSCG